MLNKANHMLLVQQAAPSRLAFVHGYLLRDTRVDQNILTVHR
jgi:hypothetical protein